MAAKQTVSFKHFSWFVGALESRTDSFRWREKYELDNLLFIFGLFHRHSSLLSSFTSNQVPITIQLVSRNQTPLHLLLLASLRNNSRCSALWRASWIAACVSSYHPRTRCTSWSVIKAAKEPALDHLLARQAQIILCVDCSWRIFIFHTAHSKLLCTFINAALTHSGVIERLWSTSIAHLDPRYYWKATSRFRKIT